MTKYKYLFIYFTPLVIFVSIYYSGVWTFTAAVSLFVLVPILEIFMPNSVENLSALEEEITAKNKFYDVIIYSMIPIHFFLLFLFLNKITSIEFSILEQIGMIIACGLSCGVLGINVAHELGHRNTGYEKWMSKIQLMSSLYMHFYIEHNKGHHKHVSTDRDPASALYGETIYSFFIRSVKDSWISAWNIETERLSRTAPSVWTLKNEMIQFIIIQLSFCGLIIFVFGINGLLYFLIVAVFGFHLLEMVNYIQHYGLRRKKKNETVYERTLPIHSWNSNHPLGRILLFELTRHSDHHYMTSRRYQILRNFDESPQMPTGYPGMMLLTLVPFLWFRVMHKEISKFKFLSAGNDLA